MMTLPVGMLSGNTVSVRGNQILQDGEAVKVVGLRCSNALSSDRSTNELIKALDLYQEYGLNAVSIFFMGSRKALP